MYFSECDVAADEELAEKAQALADLASALEIHGRIAARDLAATADSICAIYQRAIDIALTVRHATADCPMFWLGMAQAHEAAGDIAAAADYDIQARQLFDELGLPPDLPNAPADS